MSLKKRTDFWQVCLGLLLVVALLTPGIGQASEEPGSSPAMQREKLAKDLNLTPEKAKEFQMVGEKYDQSREEIIGQMRNNESELEKALAVTQPDEAKIKELVAAIAAGHDKLVDTFKAQRREEMLLLTPVQQGKFLMALKKWHEEMCMKYDEKVKKE
jgi:Spy/CpxP family protein refolding chaperone